jgi:hypothetical protein
MERNREDFMQFAEDRRRLMERLGSESVTALGTVLKCAAGIIVLVVVAAGPWALLGAGGPTDVNEGHPAPQADAALAESKRIFDERRRAYEAVRSGSAVGASNATQQRLAVE